ncbi:Vacuolar protein sorting-associated protein 53 [Chionoecetes opilio]|uniref:Vacuolar protein sorting-associated protein 53 n=1 Tax=Chionoecetes opilio TaxID=41210 RepID=A0A8J5CHL6_CHIOP|nr:Vacuolar protein sorting-associated protein 53 [Chionoecetes opilio]
MYVTQQILPSDDPFDAADFDAVAYINARFPAEQSLHHIDDVLEEMRLRATATDTQIRDVVRSLASADQDGRTSLLHAQEAIAELFSRFQDIKGITRPISHRESPGMWGSGVERQPQMMPGALNV